MLRVNLLPPYIFDKQKKVKWVALYGAVLAAVVALFIFLSIGVQATLNTAKQRLDQANNLKSEYDGYQGNIDNVNKQIADTKAKQDFIAQAQNYNISWPRVYEAMASVTVPTVKLNSLFVDPGNHKMLRFNGFSPNEMNLARWWMLLRNQKEMFDSVFISLPPHPYPPETTNTGQVGGPAGGYGPGGFGGGMGRPMMAGGPPGMSGMPGMAMGGPGRGYMGGGPPMMSGYPGMAGGFGGGRMGGFGGAGNAGNGQVGPDILEGRRGLDFVANALLKDTLAPPAIAPIWPAGGGGGGFAGGRMGGFGGMMPGMPPGAMSGPPPGMSGGPGGRSASSGAAGAD